MMSWEMALARVASAISPDVIIVVTLEIGSWYFKWLERNFKDQIGNVIKIMVSWEMALARVPSAKSPELVNLGRAKFT